MKWAVLSTWKMSLQGCAKASELLENGSTVDDAIMEGISDVEDNPDFHSVGFSGRPDRTGRVKLDGGFMDGDTLHFGAVGSIEGFRSPVRIAHALLDGNANNFLVGTGAEEWARAHGFEERDNYTEDSRQIYEEEKERLKDLSAYDGHDTVCFVGKDQNGRICAGTSTSGLFMKEPGRVGDSPVPGAGYYADSEYGAASATGMGEEIMKGALSYAAVMYLKVGKTAQEAADLAVLELDRRLKKKTGMAQPMSLIVIDRNGNYGVGTNIAFTFCYGAEGEAVSLYSAEPSERGAVIREITPDEAVTD